MILILKKLLPESMKSNIMVGYGKSLHYNNRQVYRFTKKKARLLFKEKLHILSKFLKIHGNIRCLHDFGDIVHIANYLDKFKYNTINEKIAEFGVYRGGSSAKLSILANTFDMELDCYDSFEGLPKNKEPVAKTTLGYSRDLEGGDYSCRMSEVIKNISQYGFIDKCNFFKGWFKNTIPKNKTRYLVVFCDVDLLSSTKEVLEHVFPRMIVGGRFYIQDYHIPIIREYFRKNYSPVVVTEQLAYITKR